LTVAVLLVCDFEEVSGSQVPRVELFKGNCSPCRIELLLQKLLVFDGMGDFVALVAALFLIFAVLSRSCPADLFVLPAALLILFSEFIGLSPFFPFKANFG
jgi:hypothetical protein